MSEQAPLPFSPAGPWPALVGAVEPTFEDIDWTMETA